MSGRYVNSLLGLHGGVVCWTGMWSMLDNDYFVPSRFGLARSLGYFLVGLLLFILYECYLGFKVREPSELHLEFDRHFRSRGSVGYSYLISVLILVASALAWVGLYNILDFYLPEQWIYECSFVLIGLLLLYLTGTLFYAAGILAPHVHARPVVVTSTVVKITHDKQYPPHHDPTASSSEIDIPLERYSCTEKFTNGFYVRRFIGLLGEVILWVGAANFFERHAFRRTLLREFVYYLLGFIILTLSSDFYCALVNEKDDPEDEAPSIRTAAKPSHSIRFFCTSRPELVYLRCISAIIAFVVFWTAIDNLLESESFVLKPSIWREIFYTVFGLGVLLATDTLGGQSTPFSWSRPTQQPLHPYDAIDSDGL